MEFTLDLPIYESILDEFMDRTKFKQSCYELRQLEEMCTEVDELQNYYEETYLTEALKDPKENAKAGVKEIIKRTANTTKGLVGAYDKITTAKGNLYHSSFQLLNKLLGAIVKTIGFIMNTASILPKTIVKVLDLVGKIPGELRTKIRGDIKLYIAAKDIETLYKTSFMAELKSFIKDAKKLSSGHKYQIGVFSGDDNHVAYRMMKSYALLKTVSFEHSVINMKDPENIDTYFNKDTENITIKGADKKLNYFDALQYMINDLNTEKSDLEAIKNNLEKKDDIAHDKLKANSAPEATISAAVKATADVVTLVGNLMRCVTTDINTISNATNKILQSVKTA